MNSNIGLVDDLPERVRDKKRKREMIAERALVAMHGWIEENGLLSALGARPSANATAVATSSAN